jgi:fumarate reductase subunit C
MDSAAARATASAGVHSSTAPAYTEFHPRWYRPKISTYWWLGRWPYVKFILRELSSVAVAWTVAFTLLQLRSLTQGEAAYASFTRRASSPIIIALNVIAFAFLLLHSITWFNLAPKAMAVRVGGKRLPGILISGPQFFVWFAISAIVLWIYMVRT